ncbi:MAG: DUF2007 domain-containing protein [Deltaproteobacteria bacterium]|nr:DUF2007 domain-containing protein [Deltaproteobacteria bacterium]
MGQNLITIFRYRDLPQAGLDKSILEDHGVRCFLDNEFTIGINWLYSSALGGVKLKVVESDVARAEEILRSYHELAPETEENGKSLESDFFCPNCQSSEVEIKNYTRKFAAISLLFSLPLFFFLKRYRCKKCGYKWK